MNVKERIRFQLQNSFKNVVELYTRHFNKVGYLTKSRSNLPIPVKRDPVE